MVPSGQINIIKPMRNNQRKNHQYMLNNCGNAVATFGISPMHGEIHLARVVYALKRNLIT